MIYGLYVGRNLPDHRDVAATITEYNHSEDDSYDSLNLRWSKTYLYKELEKMNPGWNFIKNKRLVLPLEYMSEKRERMNP